MYTWWSTFVLWVLAVLAGCGVLSPLASHRLRAVDRRRERRRTYGVGLIRAADRSGGIRVAYHPRSLMACRLVRSQRLRPRNSK